MSIQVLALGKLKDRALESLVSEYVKRLKPYTPTTIVELKDGFCNGRASAYSQR